MSVPPSSPASHRETLRRRCAAQREQLTLAADAIQWRLGGIDRGVNAIRKIRLIPTLLTLIPVILAATPAFRRFGRVFSIVNTIRRLLPSR
ncbi:MAG TPA: hypothetical protein VHX52_02900 [Steroidobacteraceae bacterium]|jgi:hypothetical protein|nr:hypothetical protein [Steroidobacteraceae bacterium]